MTTHTGAELIAAERQRQITDEGYKADHDRGQERALISAAMAYTATVKAALQVSDESAGLIDYTLLPIPREWPWGSAHWKPTGDPKRDLTKAGALIAAAIDALGADA